LGSWQYQVENDNWMDYEPADQDRISNAFWLDFLWSPGFDTKVVLSACGGAEVSFNFGGDAMQQKIRHERASPVRFRAFEPFGTGKRSTAFNTSKEHMQEFFSNSNTLQPMLGFQVLNVQRWARGRQSPQEWAAQLKGSLIETVGLFGGVPYHWPADLPDKVQLQFDASTEPMYYEQFRRIMDTANRADGCAQQQYMDH